MSSAVAMKGLLDKEWRHNRGYLLVTLLLIVFVPVIRTIWVLLQGDAALWQWGQELNYALHFGTDINLLRTSAYSELLAWLPYMGSLLLGIIILGEEQRGSLRFLVGTPVSRRQIILAKFLAGAATILIAILINCLFLISLNWLQPMPFSCLEVLNWGFLAGTVCLGYFAMALMVSTFINGFLATGIIVYLFGIMLPGMFAAMIGGIAARYFAASQAVSIRIYTIGSYLNLNDYITRSGRNVSQVDYPGPFVTSSTSYGRIEPDYLLESGLILVGVLGLLVLAVIIFERVSLSAGGPMFSSRWPRQAALGIGAIFIAYILVFPRAETLLAFTIYMVLVTGLICAGMRFLYRWRRSGWRVGGRLHKER